METIIKEFREQIAKLEKEQKTIKPQRKTVHFKGERTLTPYDAWVTAKHNKELLRAMYAAYNLLRGKNFYITEKNAKPIKLKDYYELFGIFLKHPSTISLNPINYINYKYEKFEGKHPLTMYLIAINYYLENYGYRLPRVEIEYKRWNGEKYKTLDYDIDNYEKIIHISE